MRRIGGAADTHRRHPDDPVAERRHLRVLVPLRSGVGQVHKSTSGQAERVDIHVALALSRLEVPGEKNGLAVRGKAAALVEDVLLARLERPHIRDARRTIRGAEISHLQRPLSDRGSLERNALAPEQPVARRREVRMQHAADRHGHVRQLPETGAVPIHHPQVVVDP